MEITQHPPTSTPTHPCWTRRMISKGLGPTPQLSNGSQWGLLPLNTLRSTAPEKRGRLGERKWRKWPGTEGIFMYSFDPNG